MGKTVMGAVVSLDGFIADDSDDVGPLFAWCGNGDVTRAFEGADHECRITEPLRLENPTTIVPGEPVTHFVYDVSR